MPVTLRPYKTLFFFFGLCLPTFSFARISLHISPGTAVVPLQSCTWVVLGSSTAEGAGASVKDSAWVTRLQTYLTRYQGMKVINLGKGGITSFHIMPGHSANESLVFQPDTSLNIDRALSFQPRGIIVNMPSNDAANYIDAHSQMENFRTIQRMTLAAGSEFWITTSQPRNFGDPKQISIQQEIRDSILHNFGMHAIDLFTPLADSMSWLLPHFGSGDGIHLNDQGHKLIFQSVVAHIFPQPQCAEIRDQHPFSDPSISGDLGQIHLVPMSRSLVWNLIYQGDKKGPKQVQIFNASGRLILSRTLEDGPGSWPLNVSPEDVKHISVIVRWDDGSILKSSASIK